MWPWSSRARPTPSLPTSSLPPGTGARSCHDWSRIASIGSLPIVARRRTPGAISEPAERTSNVRHRSASSIPRSAPCPVSGQSRKCLCRHHRHHVPAPSCEAAYRNDDADAREREITETTMQMVLFASFSPRSATSPRRRKFSPSARAIREDRMTTFDAIIIGTGQSGPPLARRRVRKPHLEPRTHARPDHRLKELAKNIASTRSRSFEHLRQGPLTRVKRTRRPQAQTDAIDPLRTWGGVTLRRSTMPGHGHSSEIRWLRSSFALA
jgi:hypothetical protein